MYISPSSEDVNAQANLDQIITVPLTK